MSERQRLFACIISPETAERRDALQRIAKNFAHPIEMLEDGVLFDVSGLERIVGKPDRVSQKILNQMKRLGVAGNAAVADTADAAMLLARKDVQSASFSLSNVADKQAKACTLTTTAEFGQLPLIDLGLQRDTLNVFNDLGLKNIDDLLAVPKDDLVGRYGREFISIIDRIHQKSDRLITPNVKESKVSWSFDLDHAVEDFEQLIFIVNHGLDDLFARVSDYAKSTEQLDISFRLTNRTVRNYEIKTSFPTLDRSFWVKLVNLRVALHAPEAGILSVDVTAHFTKPRPSQKGLYAVSRPEPESLLLTVNKLKKLVGESHVGVPVLVNQRLARPFELDAEKIPNVTVESNDISSRHSPLVEQINFAFSSDYYSTVIDFSTGKAIPSSPVIPEVRSSTISFIYYRPARPVDVLFRNKQIVNVMSREISGHVTNCSGVWRASSQWWQHDSWKTKEWDVELEDAGIYRIAKAGDEWVVIGEYD